jgi:hypothetical protein
MSDGKMEVPADLAMVVGNTKESKVRGEFAPSVHLIPKDRTSGRWVVGEYLGSRTVKGEYMGKENSSLVHRIKLKNTNAPITLDKEGVLVDVAPSEAQGKEISVWGFGQMDKFISTVKIGNEIAVLYGGKTDGYHQGRFWNLANEEVPF